MCYFFYPYQKKSKSKGFSSKAQVKWQRCEFLVQRASRGRQTDLEVIYLAIKTVLYMIKETFRCSYGLDLLRTLLDYTDGCNLII